MATITLHLFKHLISVCPLTSVSLDLQTGHGVIVTMMAYLLSLLASFNSLLFSTSAFLCLISTKLLRQNYWEITLKSRRNFVFCWFTLFTQITATPVE